MSKEAHIFRCEILNLTDPQDSGAFIHTLAEEQLTSMLETTHGVRYVVCKVV